MKNLNKELLIGILVLAISASSLLIKSIPIIWIGGFIWGVSLVAKSVNHKKQYSFKTGEIEKEIITCDNCKQKIRVPVDKEKYINITCPHCRQNPFLSLSDKFHRSSMKVKLLWIGGGILVVLIFVCAIFNPIGSSQNTPTITTTKTVYIPQQNQIPSIIPVATNIVNFSNGEFLNKNSSYLDGLGELQIKNGTSNDAVAKLVNTLTDKSIATVFISANSNFTIRNISDGDYKLVFNLGHDWDTISKKFTRNSSYSVFEDNFYFNTTDTKYSVYEVTLNPVIGGTAKTEDINVDAFINY